LILTARGYRLGCAALGTDLKVGHHGWRVTRTAKLFGVRDRREEGGVNPAPTSKSD
jgi:hypothetical protein